MVGCLFLSFLLWILSSLIAITLIGDYPYLALAVAGLAGIAFGLNAYLDNPEIARSGPRSEQGTVIQQKRRIIVARYGWMLDIVATVLLIFPSRWFALGFLLVLASWLLRWWGHGRIIRRSAFDLPILALMLMVLVSLAASADLMVSLITLGQVVAGINGFYAITQRMQSPSDLQWATAGFIALGLFLALVAPFSVEWIKTKYFALPQIYGQFRVILPKGIHPNLMAGALTVIAPVGWAMFLFAPLEWFPVPMRRIVRALLGVALAAIGIVLLLTQSRGGITATLVVLTSMLVLRFPKVLFATPLMVLGLVLFLSKLDWQSFLDLYFSTDEINGLAGREEVWSRAVYVLQDVPFTGIGLGMFSRAVHVLYPLFLVGPDVDIGYAHNVYLQVGVDLGIPGLVAYVAILTLAVLVTFSTFRRARRCGQGDLAAIALGLGLGLTAAVLHGLVDSAIWDTKPSLLAWTLWGLIASVGTISREELEIETKAKTHEPELYDHETTSRSALDRLLYGPPTFDRIVQSQVAFLETKPNERILDLGCGEGKEVLALAQLGLRVVAVDLSLTQLLRVRRLVKDHCPSACPALVQANVEELPFAPGTFPVIYGKAILHHVDSEIVTAETRRVLQPGGRATFAEPMAHHPLFRLARWLTPRWRSRSEHPFSFSDFRRFAEQFVHWQIDPAFLLSPFAYVFRVIPRGELFFRKMHALLQIVDGWLFTRFPALCCLAWYSTVYVQTAA